MAVSGVVTTAGLHEHNRESPYVLVHTEPDVNMLVYARMGMSQKQSIMPAMESFA